MLNGVKSLRRVVITGIGCVTPIGIGREAFWDALIAGESGVRRIEPRPVPLALAATREALNDSQIATGDLSLEERRQIGVVLGTGGGGLTFVEDHYSIWYQGGSYSKASVYIIPAATHGTLSSELSMAFGLRGLSHVISTGCTSSTDAVAYASQHIAVGRQDVMIAGGVDAPLAPGILAAFNLLTVLTTEWNDEPQRASRPFSLNRSGMVLGEGAWIYVLEDLDRAQKRGAKIYAEITGYGATCDAYHRVRLAEDGDEPARAMYLALKDAGRQPREIDYVNLHGTSTLLNDRIETSALKLAFDGHARKIPMSATKSQVGHPQGASGAAGLAAALCAMHRKMIPPTINLDEPDPDCDLDYVPNLTREANIQIALCNCIGFGSKNSALVIEKC
jgi:3-oxoacyl-[acyl-carrier-protein] synthase II